MAERLRISSDSPFEPTIGFSRAVRVGDRVVVSGTGLLLARELGAAWVGDALDHPPELLDRAVTFAPSGDVVLAALGSLRKGGVVAINAIHLDRMPQFDYDTLLWGERQLRSVANMTREDARDFVALAHQIGIRPKTTLFSLSDVNRALDAVRHDSVDGAAVVMCQQ